MVTQHDAFDTILDSHFRILHALNPLEHDWQPRSLFDPCQVGPCQRLVNVLSHQPTESTSLLVGRSFGPADGRLHIASSDALVGLALARDWCIYCNENRLDS